MEKASLIAFVLCVLLVAGAVLASAKFLEEDVEEIEVDEAEQVCGPRTCNQQCGGNCEVPRCGCS